VVFGLGLGTAIGAQFIERSTGPASDKAFDLAGVPVLRIEAAHEPQPAEAWALPGPWAGELPSGPDAFARLMRGQAGVEVGRSYARLVVDSRRTGTVVITDMRAIPLVKDPPLDGTLFTGAPCGGPEASLVLTYDLDRGDQAETAEGERFFDANHVTLKPGEPVVIVISATAKDASYQWQIKVDFTVDGRQRTQLIPEHSHPLQVTGSARKYRATFRPVDCRGGEWRRGR
jgi:hypothetical protein